MMVVFRHREVERLAGLRRIRLRAGAFCNPGATAAALGLGPEDVRSHYEDAGHVCWDARDLIGAEPRLPCGHVPIICTTPSSRP